MEIFERQCPKCNKILHYSTKSAFIHAIKKNKTCRACTQRKPYRIKQPRRYFRECPTCHKTKEYSRGGHYLATKNNSNCIDCANLICTKHLGKYADGQSGDKNPFYGKKHTEKFKNKLRKRYKGQFPKGFKKGTSVYVYWLENYGKEEADRRFEAYKAKHSENSSGSKNSMYGKPAPGGSGVGWKGWYRGWFFRSLKELAYAVQLDADGKNWRSAECLDLRITYLDYQGKTRTYCADFLVDNCVMVEIKPLRLHTSPSVLAKKEAGVVFCKERGWAYIIIDPDKFQENKIKELHDAGDIKFTDRYEKLYKETYDA